jgi:mannose-P-dolichol utilization defect protein 1
MTSCTVLNAYSTRGLSLTAYILETLSYAITLSYSFRNGFPFSTYGENLFLTLQNIIITLLIVYLPTSSLRRAQNTTSRLAGALLATTTIGFALYTIPKDSLALLQLATLPLSLFSKLPQIHQNFRAESTGQLSAFAVISQIAGCLARLFTTATEVGDRLLAAGFALSLLLNCVLGMQMWMYWGSEGRWQSVGAGALEENEREKAPASWSSQNQVPVQDRVNEVLTPRSPTPHLGPQPSGRKWARKVDH